MIRVAVIEPGAVLYAVTVRLGAPARAAYRHALRLAHGNRFARVTLTRC